MGAPRGLLLWVWVLFVATDLRPTFAQQWGDFQDNGCTSIGRRTYASRIWNIPSGLSWDAACRTTPATIAGHSFETPARCNNKGAFGEWGEWDLDDNSCRAHWGDFQNNGCTSVDTRTFASRIWDIPPGQSWEAACRTTSATIAGHSFSAPSRCNNKGAFGEWGEWDVADNSCRAHWGDFQNNGCTSVNTRTFASRIWDIPPGQSGDTACRTTAATLPGTPAALAGAAGSLPVRCNNKGVFGEWGEWDVADGSCRAHWGTFQNNGCTAADTRTFASRIWDIPPGQSWDAACKTTTAVIEGKSFVTPARCNNKGAFGEWGEWDVADKVCFPACPYIVFDPPPASDMVGIISTPTGSGYWLVGADGGVFTFGDARFFGSTGGSAPAQPVVGMASTPTGAGYWIVAADGSVFPFGDAVFAGSLSGQRLSKPVVGMAPTKSGRGYWLVRSDGTVNAFGDAISLGSLSLSAKQVVGMAATASSRGYWLFLSDGSVSTFGDATPLAPRLHRALSKPVIAASTNSAKTSYLMASSDSDILAFGTASFQGSCSTRPLPKSIVGIAAVPSGDGYWLVDSGGGVFFFGDARVSLPATQGAKPNPRMTAGNSVAVIYDGATLFEEVTTAIENAQTSVDIVQLFFDVDFISRFGDSNIPTRLVDTLIAADRRGVKVRIMLDKVVTSGGPGPSSRDALVSAFAGTNAIVVRDFPVWEPGRLHSKAAIVDSSTAFIMGATLQQEMFDSRGHPVDSKIQRGDKEPLHTESLRVRGPAVADVEGFFSELWNHIDRTYYASKDQITAAPRSAAIGNDTVQIVRTVPPAVGVGPITGEVEILEAYQRAFANAKRFIYVENQYLLFRPILEAIRSAMDRNSALQVIAVLNQNPDQSEILHVVPLLEYREWQSREIREILGPPSSKLGLFSLWSMEQPRDGKTPIRRIYMEGKLAIIDDQWMTLGTANLDGLSMAALETADNIDPAPLGLPLLPLAESKRSFELNGIIFDGVAGAPSTKTVLQARCNAWTEHLGSAGRATCSSVPPAGGWLSLWNSVASANVASLNSATPTMSGRILPWVSGGMIKAADQLTTLGINLGPLEVRQDDN
jgi:phosphatidylserine/phosphatidylglycerophosphate/cardiolipin synthase-like enzyme